MKAHIVILNYNGEELLAKCLPSIVEAARNAKTPAQVTVLDNASRDRSREIVESFKGAVSWAESRENRVLCSYNEFLSGIPEEIVVLLNNDLRADPHFLDPLIQPFLINSDTFMVTSKSMSFDGRLFEGGRTRFRLKYGVFWASSRYPGHEPLKEIPGYTMAAGFGAFDRKKFLELGGYDDLYLPGRVEDSDLCFRAWRRGYRCLYEPKSVVYHEGGTSFHKKFGKQGTLVINHRNSFLFLWKNLEDPQLLLEHFIFLPARLLFALFTGRIDFVRGFFQAVPLAKQALSRREKEKMTPKVRTEKEIFGLV